MRIIEKAAEVVKSAHERATSGSGELSTYTANTFLPVTVTAGVTSKQDAPTRKA